MNLQDIFNRLTVKPYGGELMFAAWAGCMNWAFHKDEFRDMFEEDSDKDLSGSLEDLSDLDSDIQLDADDENTVVEFCDWATINIWGVEGVDASL